MPNKPYRTWRRWFQWRLSTWLVLVAILAWSKAARPYLEYEMKKGQHEWTPAMQPARAGLWF